MKSLILAIDVGNTRAKLAILAQSTDHQLPILVDASVCDRQRIDCPDLLDQLVSPHRGQLLGCIVAGSNRERMQQLLDTWPAEIPTPRVIHTASELPIPLQIVHPEKVGVDRVLNALAASREQSGQPAIIIDAGTATTIDAVSSAGEFLGGAIAIGYELSARALHDYTSRLPLIPLESMQDANPEVIGKQTEAALKSGLLWGQLGAIHEIVERMQLSIAADQGEPLIFLTGGARSVLAPHLRFSFIERPELTLQGLASLISS